MDFPQYRKLSNERAYYKIISSNEFEELQRLGNQVMVHKIKAEKYPELLRIMDMLSDEASFLHCTEDEYNEVYALLKS